MVMATAACGQANTTFQNVYQWVVPDDRRDEFFSQIVEGHQQEQLDLLFEPIVEDSVIFRALADQWRMQRGTTSSTIEMVLCSAYQSVIGMGPKAIQFILDQLRSEGNDPDHWFWALQALTGKNPVSEEDEGNLRKMAKAWLEWASSEGYAV